MLVGPGFSHQDIQANGTIQAISLKIPENPSPYEKALFVLTPCGVLQVETVEPCVENLARSLGGLLLTNGLANKQVASINPFGSAITFTGVRPSVFSRDKWNYLVAD